MDIAPPAVNLFQQEGTVVLESKSSTMVATGAQGVAKTGVWDQYPKAVALHFDRTQILYEVFIVRFPTRTVLVFGKAASTVTAAKSTLTIDVVGKVSGSVTVEGVIIYCQAVSVPVTSHANFTEPVIGALTKT